MNLKLSENMKLVFDLNLKEDLERIERVRKVTLDKNKPNIGLKGNNGLYRSQEWWNSISTGKMRTKIVSGEICRLYHAGQDNSREINAFDLKLESGEIVSESIYVNNNQDLSMFSIGNKAYILYAFDELKSGEFLDIVIEIAISP